MRKLTWKGKENSHINEFNKFCKCKSTYVHGFKKCNEAKEPNGGLLWLLLNIWCTDISVPQFEKDVLWCVCVNWLYSTVYSRRRSKNPSKLCVNGLCEGNSLVANEFPAHTQRASNSENVSIWWRHHLWYMSSNHLNISWPMSTYLSCIWMDYLCTIFLP